MIIPNSPLRILNHLLILIRHLRPRPLIRINRRTGPMVTTQRLLFLLWHSKGFLIVNILVFWAEFCFGFVTGLVSYVFEVYIIVHIILIILVCRVIKLRHHIKPSVIPIILITSKITGLFWVFLSNLNLHIINFLTSSLRGRGSWVHIWHVLLFAIPSPISLPSISSLRLRWLLLILELLLSVW